MGKNLKTIAAAAWASQQKTGCPGLLQLAQCALETGWLKSAPGNNCFGIKAYPGCHGRQLLTTTEWFTDAELKHFLSLGDSRTAELNHAHEQVLSGRREYIVHDWFATFETLGDCFSKRAAMWDKGRYMVCAEQFKRDGDLNALVRSIASIYATAPDYAKQVLSIIDQADVQAAWKEAQNVVA
jgi:flagellar protein FlgJ